LARQCGTPLVECAAASRDSDGGAAGVWRDRDVAVALAATIRRIVSCEQRASCATSRSGTARIQHRAMPVR